MRDLYEELLNSEVKYSEKLIVQLIRLNRERYGEIKNITKKIIFFMMKKIILRGVIQFVSINKNRFNDTPYEKKDMVIEIYLVFENCLAGFDLEKNKNFYLYFNSAVSRRISRMANYKSMYNSDHRKISLDLEFGNSADGETITMKDFLSSSIPENNGSVDITDHKDIFYMGFTEVEINVMKSLYNRDTEESVLRDNNLTKKELKNLISKIKKELGDRYEIEQCDNTR